MNINELLTRIDANRKAGRPEMYGLSQDEMSAVHQSQGRVGYNYDPHYATGMNGQVPYMKDQYMPTSDGYRPDNSALSDMEAYMGRSHVNPQYQAEIQKYNNIQNASKLSNAGVLGYDVSQSLGQINRSNNAIAGLQKPSQVAPIEKNKMLQREMYLAKMRASQGMSGQQKDFANYQGLDNFLKSKEVAGTATAGQAAGYGSATQKAILDRYKYGIQNNILNDNIRRQNQGVYNNMIGQSMGENNNIRNQQMVNYNDSLNQYNQRQAAAQHLGQSGRINMRKSIGDARELAPTMVPGYGYAYNPYAQRMPAVPTTSGANASLYNDPEINKIVQAAHQNTSDRYTVPAINNDPQIQTSPVYNSKPWGY